MKLRPAAQATLLLLMLGAACGRVDEEGDGGTGGEAGAPTSGGLAATGGFVSSGGSGAFTTGGQLTGGTNTGGASSTGGTKATGGTASGGAKSTGGANAGGFAGGEGGFGGVPSRNVPIGESSWEVEMAVTVTGKTVPLPVTCNLAHFTMHLEPKAGGLTMLAGRDGSVMPGEFALVSGPSPSYRGNTVAVLPSVGDCTVSSIQVESVLIYATDFDGDGVADELSGDGKGSALQIQGDVGVSAPLTFVLNGIPDSHGPSLILPPSVTPLVGVRVLASEPVALASKVTLKSGAISLALEGFTPSDGALGSFSSPAVLPFGSSWDVAVTGADLAGFPFTTAGLTPIKVMADPGIFSEDGFESAPKALLTGNAAVVATVGELPAINGSKSLFVPPSGTAMLHLARSAGKDRVRFTAQMLASGSGLGGSPPPVEVGVYFGTQRVRPGSSMGSATTPTGDTTWAYAGPKQDYTLSLTEPEGDVVFAVAPPGCFGFCPAPQAVLIDDVRVE